MGSIERFTDYLIDTQPELLEMAVPEMWEWLSEYCTRYEYVEPTATTRAHYLLVCDMISETTGYTLAQAVQLAAAKLEEANT